MQVPPCTFYDESGTSHASPVERGGTYFTKGFLMSAVSSATRSPTDMEVFFPTGDVGFSTFHLLFGKVNLIKCFKRNYVHCKINTYIGSYIFILFIKFFIYYKNYAVTNLTFKRKPLIKY